MADGSIKFSGESSTNLEVLSRLEPVAYLVCGLMSTLSYPYFIDNKLKKYNLILFNFSSIYI